MRFYKTMDALAGAGLFWPSLRQRWPFGFEIGVDQAASMENAELGIAILVSCVDREEMLVLVRVQKMAELEPDVPHLDVTLDAEGRFMAGTRGGMESDELGCADALAAVFPLFDGNWKLESEPDAEVAHG